MTDTRDTHDHEDLIRYEKSGEGRRHHRGRSSESVLDKEAILATLNVQPGQTVLDAGCGNGYMAKEFSALVGEGGTVYAIDRDEVAIGNLREETEGTNIVAQVADITAPTGLPAAAFDVVYIANVVHAFSSERMPGFIAEVRRLLGPRGRLAVVEIVKRATPYGPPLEQRLSPEELTAALGLKPVALADAGEYFYMQLFENAAGA